MLTSVLRGELRHGRRLRPVASAGWRQPQTQRQRQLQLVRADLGPRRRLEVGTRSPRSDKSTQRTRAPHGDAPEEVVPRAGEPRAADEGARAPEFNSLSYHGKILQRDGTPANITRRGADGSEESGEEWSVKIFSKQKIEDRWLRRVFGEVGWVHRKEVRRAS